MPAINLSLTTGLLSAEVLQYLAWLIALIQVIIGMYLLYLNPRQLANRILSASLFVIAINTFAAGMLATAVTIQDALLPIQILAATTATIVVALLLCMLVLFYQEQISRRRFKSLVWVLVLIGALPLVLTLIDVLFGAHLWYAGLNPAQYFGGFIHQSFYVTGRLNGPLNGLIYGLLGALLMALLVYTLVFNRRASRQARLVAIWLLLSNLVYILLAYLSVNNLIPAPQVGLAFYLLVSVLYLIAFTPALIPAGASISTDLSTRGRRGRLQVRLTILALIVALPLLAGMGLFLTQQAQLILERDAALALNTTNRSLVEAGEIWLTYNTRALRTMVASPDIISMDPVRQTSVLRTLVSTYPDMYLASTTDPSGMNVARSDGQEMVTYNDRAWYQQAVSGRPVVYQTLVGGAGQPAFVISMPIRSSEDQILGVGMAASDLKLVSRLLDQAVQKSGETAYLINSDNRILAISGRPIGILMEDLSDYPPVQALRSGVIGDFSFNDINETGWRASLNLLTNGWGVIVQQTEQVLFAPVRDFQRIALVVLVVGAALLFWLTWLTIRQVMQPVRSLTDAAAAISDGDLSVVAPVYSNDELGVLANTFNNMTAQLRDLVTSLENRVNERTRDLQRRAVQLQVTAQVAREAAAIRETDRLLQNTARLISEQFNFYHAGIFLLDRPVEITDSPVQRASLVVRDESGAERPVYAILRAASSEGGRRMLARGHRLQVGKQGIVGYVAGTGTPRIALDTDKDTAYFDNPDLPMTRSEMALPLKVGTRVIGVLDVQSRQANAFNQDDLETLQVLADQIALAIENARLLTDSQQALRELEELYGMQIRQGWQRTIKGMRPGGKNLGYMLGPRGVEPLENSRATSRATAASSSEIMLPIELRTQKLGMLRLRREAENSEWSAQDQALIQDVLGQLALALENARLMEEIRSHARQEELISQIVSSTQSSLSLEGVMRTAVQEVARALHVSHVRLQLDQSDGEYGDDRKPGSTNGNGGQP